MTLESFMAHINTTTFWEEFTFSETRFRPRPADEVELADGIVKVGSLGLVFQLKERAQETDDAETEKRWFERKVIRKATDQIKDSLKYLSDHEEIVLTNGRGREMAVRGAELSDLKKIVVYLGGRHLPQECRDRMYHVSATAGFIHVFAANDYLGILDKLRVPDDVRLYLEYREEVLPRLQQAGTVVEEPDIMVAFLKERDLPEPGSRDQLRGFVQDLTDFDLSEVMRELQAHIVNPTGGTEYYRILEEFARVPRSVWREFKARLVLALKASKTRQPKMPFRFAFPPTDISFMVASMDPEWPSTGEDGTRMRTGALTMFSEGVKYSLRTRVCVGALVSMDGDQYQIDWCLLDEPWEANSKMEALLTENPQLFRPVSEKRIDRYFFRESESDGS